MLLAQIDWKCHDTENFIHTKQNAEPVSVCSLTATLYTGMTV